MMKPGFIVNGYEIIESLASCEGLYRVKELGAEGQSASPGTPYFTLRVLTLKDRDLFQKDAEAQERFDRDYQQYLRHGEMQLGRYAEMYSTLHHPALPELHRYFANDERTQFYLVMHFIEGEPLTASFENSLMDPFTSVDHLRIIRITGNILDLLSYLDSQEQYCLHPGILNPRNILVDCNDMIKIVDCGIPETFLQQDCSFSLMPTGQNPEEAAHDAVENIEPKSEKTDIRTIIYTLGGVLNTLITGEPPSPTEVRAGNDKPENPVDMNETLYPAMKKLITKALAVMPHERYQSTGEMKEDLEKCLPKLRVKPEEALNLNFVDHGMSLLTLEIINEAPGSLPVEGYVHSDIPGIRIEPDKFINDEKIEIFVLPGSSEPGVRKGKLIVTSNIEKKLIPFSFSYLMNNPELSVTPDTIDLGTIPPLTRTERIALENRSSASLPLHGTLTADKSFIELSRHEFYGNSIAVEVTIKVQECTPGLHDSTIRIESNGGTKELKVSFTIEASESETDQEGSPSESVSELKSKPEASPPEPADKLESGPVTSYAEAAKKTKRENPMHVTPGKKKPILSTRAKRSRVMIYSACALLLILCTVSILFFKPLFCKATPPPSRERLFEYVQKGDLKSLGEALDTWPDLINVKDSKGRSLLHFAIECTQTGNEILTLLIAHKADINSKSEYTGDTPLHTAAMLGRAECARALIEKGASIDVRDAILGQTPLHRACLYGHSDIVLLLLDNNAYINATDDVYGDTPLHKASLKGYREIVKLLVNRGADLHKCDREGQSAIDVARKYEKDEEVNILRGID